MTVHELDQINRDLNLAIATTDVLTMLQHPEALLPDTLSDLAHDLTVRLERVQEMIEDMVTIEPTVN